MEKEKTTKKSSGLKIALGIAVALFLGTGFYTMNLHKELTADNKQLAEEKQLVMDDLSAMAKQYDVAIGENEIANENLIEARARIQGLIDSLKVSETNVKSLWKYKQRYTSLQKEMNVLLAQNDSLKLQNSYLSTNLDSTRVRLEQSNIFKDSLLVQNSALAEVVENASVLGTVALTGSGVIERASGKVIPTERAKRADKIKICFTVVKNSLVQAGDQKLYIQVVGPRTNTLGLNEHVTFNNQLINYSLISEFNYEDASLDICEYLNLQGAKEFETGRYTINVYNTKNLVATSEFTLK